ncbi:MAG TPA: tetratricopeptide repeat protein, partial [Gemmatimonadaceae bacterium]
SWKRTALGGVAAVGALIVFTGVWMLMRTIGIGPAGSLMAMGKLGERDRVILTEFRSPGDSLLGATVTEAFRTDLAQSANLQVLPASTVREALQRMQRPPNTRVDFALAREIATREGIKAVVDGQIVALGGRYVLSARMVASRSGEELALVSETAADESDIIPAISRLSKHLRERTGESLRRIQKARSLERVTTPSLAALQKYVAAIRTLEEEGDWDRGRLQLEEALALDSTFAMAWRKLAMELSNRSYPADEVAAAIQKAYDYRDRLTDSERYLAIAGYYTVGPALDRNRAISAYESLLALDPYNVAALNNLASTYLEMREFAKAEPLLERAMTQQSSAAFYINAIWTEIAQGKFEEARRTLEAFASALPRNPQWVIVSALLESSQGKFDVATALLDSLSRARANEPTIRGLAAESGSLISFLQGRLADGLRHRASLWDAWAVMRRPEGSLHAALDSAEFEAWYLGNKQRGRTLLDRALTSHPVDSLPPLARPYDRIAWIASLVGDLDRARAALSAFDRRREKTPQLTDEQYRNSWRGTSPWPRGAMIKPSLPTARAMWADAPSARPPISPVCTTWRGIPIRSSSISNGS